MHSYRQACAVSNVPWRAVRAQPFLSALAVRAIHNMHRTCCYGRGCAYSGCSTASLGKKGVGGIGFVIQSPLHLLQMHRDEPLPAKAGLCQKCSPRHVANGVPDKIQIAYK